MRNPLFTSVRAASLMAALAGVLLTLSVSMAQKTEERNCSVEITSPKPDDKVKGDGLVRGKAKVPDKNKNFLWVLVHREGLERWWPQGDGPANIRDGEWKVLVKYGVPGERGTFEIAAVVVDTQTNADLMKWVQDAQANGYPPIEFPSTTEGCPVRTTVVEKTGN